VKTGLGPTIFCAYSEMFGRAARVHGHRRCDGKLIVAGGAVLPVAIAYAWRIRVEETALRERFGAEFDAHRKRTWAIIPLVW